MRPRAHIDEIATRQRRTSPALIADAFSVVRNRTLGVFLSNVMGGTPMRQAQSSPIFTGVEKSAPPAT